MKILRAFQVINQDGTYVVSDTYNEIDETGSISKRNEKDSFYAVDSELEENIKAIEQFIEKRLDAE